MNILLIVLICNFGKVVLGVPKKISDALVNYFNDESIRTLYDKWEVHRVSVENALELALKQTFGKPGLNVYVKSVDDTHKVSQGFLIDDNIVSTLFKDMYLTRYPYLRNPRVWFPLASNVLRVEASVSKMFIDSQYLLLRNYTDVVYPADKDRENSTSPFARQQVQNTGQATIIAEYCILHGETLAVLQGSTVILGFDNFELSNCKFSLEISTPDLGSPPVIVPYFSEEQGTQLSRKLMTTLYGELMPKLEAAVHSTVNTTTALGSLLPEVRQLQRNVFRTSADYTSEVLRNLNKITAMKNKASEIWKNYRITWKENQEGVIKTNMLSLTNMTVSGLDSVYAGRSGGPVKTDSIKLLADLRFAGIQIHGTGFIQMHGRKETFKFSTEVQDVICYTMIEISRIENDDSSRKPMALPKEVQSLRISSWRNLEIFGPTFPTIDTYSWINGVLSNRVPVLILKHLSRYFKDAVQYTENPFEIKQSLTPDNADPKSREEQAYLDEIYKDIEADKQANLNDKKSSEVIENPKEEVKTGDENDENPHQNSAEKGKEEPIERMFKTKLLSFNSDSENALV